MKEQTAEPTPAPAVDLGDPQWFINRELSWLNFNWRVMEEALNEKAPLLERVKFLGIYANNLDEFFMIRVSGLLRKANLGIEKLTVDGMTATDQLAAIRAVLLEQFKTLDRLWNETLRPLLNKAGIRILSHSALNEGQKSLLRRYFEGQVFPLLTPLAFDPSHPWPHISNLSLNLAVVIREQPKVERFARIKVSDFLPRFLPVPAEDQTDLHQYIGKGKKSGAAFILIEDLVAANLDKLFPDMEVVASFPFRITRDADMEIEEDDTADLMSSIEEGLEMRGFGHAVRLEINENMPSRIRNLLINNFKIEPMQAYAFNSMLGMSGLMRIAQIDRPDLKDSSFSPILPSAFSTRENAFKVIARRDALVYHPYDSFGPTVDFLRQAASDPDVLDIKQTLYRVGGNSPVVDALLEARKNDKQVSVVVELKARFDEEHNIAWARALEDEGVHVVYGVIGLKVHAKLCLVVRREGDKLVRYVHLGTGNYNPVTARLYTDIALFSADPDLGADVSELFNALTGYSRQKKYRKLIAAPGLMKSEIIERIERETRRHENEGDGYLAFKLNALVDRGVIQALYRASQKGVKIDIQARGICCLRPGAPGVSDNIRVTSIVGRFLEHSRIYYFRNGGDEEILVGSADLMPRNLHRRVETLFPIENEELKALVRDQILFVHLKDTAQSRLLKTDGSYVRVSPKKGEEPFDSQAWLIEQWGQEVD